MPSATLGTQHASGTGFSQAPPNQHQGKLLAARSGVSGKGIGGGVNSSLPKAPCHTSVGSATDKLLFELCLAAKGWKSPAVLSRGAGAMWGALPWKAETIGLKHIQLNS